MRPKVIWSETAKDKDDGAKLCKEFSSCARGIAYYCLGGRYPDNTGA